LDQKPGDAAQCQHGQDILACIVTPGLAGRRAALRAHCLVELGRYKTPREFRFVAELPKGPSGGAAVALLSKNRDRPRFS
jgi:acyl-CoA synthetase (AMP-forming)/AMP-acid ligase II